MAKSSTSDSSVWRLDSEKATLCTPHLTASIDLLNPCAGFNQLVFQEASIEGFALGIHLGTHTDLAKHDVRDAFVRGSDLVVTYAETANRPFSLQVYWRATVGERGALLLDTILALQTDLLESFPQLAVETELPAKEAWLLHGENTPASASTIPCDLSPELSEGILLRPAKGNWSYAETSHPDDRGESHIDSGMKNTWKIHRQLGGSFLEKGVIRSLRVRGVFLPQEDDLELAARCLASLATEEPPLTV